MATPEQRARLKAARDTEFDRLFLTLMIAHHQGALAMSRTRSPCQGRARQGHRRVRADLARDIESSQRAEINRMRDLMPED